MRETALPDSGSTGVSRRRFVVGAGAAVGALATLIARVNGNGS